MLAQQLSFDNQTFHSVHSLLAYPTSIPLLHIKHVGLLSLLNVNSSSAITVFSQTSQPPIWNVIVERIAVAIRGVMCCFPFYYSLFVCGDTHESTLHNVSHLLTYQRKNNYVIRDQVTNVNTFIGLVFIDISGSPMYLLIMEITIIILVIMQITIIYLAGGAEEATHMCDLTQICNHRLCIQDWCFFFSSRQS